MRRLAGILIAKALSIDEQSETKEIAVDPELQRMIMKIFVEEDTLEYCFRNIAKLSKQDDFRSYLDHTMNQQALKQVSQAPQPCLPGSPEFHTIEEIARIARQCNLKLNSVKNPAHHILIEQCIRTQIISLLKEVRQRDQPATEGDPEYLKSCWKFAIEAFLASKNLGIVEPRAKATEMEGLYRSFSASKLQSEPE